MTDDETGLAERRHHRVIPAVLVIAVGVIFLCITLGVPLPFLDWTNWWAWFILIGAAWPLSEAWERYRIAGTLDGEVWHSLLHALAVVMVAMVFILSLSWAKWWPLFVIYGGLSMLVPGSRRSRRAGVR